MVLGLDKRRLRTLARRSVSFGGIGVAGLIVDMAVLRLMLSAVGLGLYSGRVVSFLAAATVTWLGNRLLTFRDRRSPRYIDEWLRFLAVNGPGGAVNYAVYAVLVTHVAMLAEHASLAVAVGSVAGMLFNFTGSALIVFRGRG
jgi:putative flippase GtrA